MTDDELVFEYLSTDSDGDRAHYQHLLRERGVDTAELDMLNANLTDPGMWHEPSADLEELIMAEVYGEGEAETHRMEARPLVAPTPPPTAMGVAADRFGADRVGVERVAAERVGIGVAEHIASASSTLGDRDQRRKTRSPGRSRAAFRWVGAVAAGLVAGIFVGRVAFDRGVSFDGSTTLAATRLAPGATGTLRFKAEDAGVRLQLDATGLPEPKADQFYAAWLAAEGTDVNRPDAPLLSIGTFSRSGQAALWSGVTLDQAPIVSVTLEQRDGNPASSGQVVLQGRVSA